MSTIGILLMVFGGVALMALAISDLIRRFYWKEYKRRQGELQRLKGRP